MIHTDDYDWMPGQDVAIKHAPIMSTNFNKQVKGSGRGNQSERWGYPSILKG